MTGSAGGGLHDFGENALLNAECYRGEQTLNEVAVILGRHKMTLDVHAIKLQVRTARAEPAPRAWDFPGPEVHPYDHTRSLRSPRSPPGPHNRCAG